jgi:hypothetical protein
VNDEQYVEDGVYDVTQHQLADRPAAQAILDQFEIGQEYPCWYDPIDPHRVILVRGYSPWLYVSLLIPLSFMIIGGGRLIYTLFHWNTSEERRSLLTQRAAQLDLFEVETDGREFPFRRRKPDQ